ncbi:MAG: glycosyl hydrolase-related protein, partial [Solirubrobacteraceae bacterium]
LRAVGWLSRPDLRTRPGPAGPALPVPDAQLHGALEAELRLFALDGAHSAASAAREAELPLQAVTMVGQPRTREGVPLLALEPRTLVLSALKPAEHGDGVVLRVANPGDTAQRAVVRLGFALTGAHALRLDESRADFAIERSGDTVAFDVPPHALRTVLLVASAPR